MTRPVDRQTITLLTDRCAARGRCRVYFDLAPSGRVHPGILRALLYARQLSGELAQAGIGCEILIRVNDRAPVRGGVSAERRNAQPGRRWRDFSDPATGKAYPELFRDELDAILRAIGVDARVLDASTIYNDPAFQNLAWEIVDRHRFFPQMRQTVYPVSRATGRMYVTETIWRDGRLTALCLESRQSQIVARDFDGGLIGYRLENALMWRHFGIDLDLHAANQSFNYHGSAQISHALFGAIAVPPRLGIVLGDDGKMVSKSRCNFLPVFEAISKHGPDALCQYLSQRPWWRDLPARR
jgi:lysyl-tRNA synthetase class I